MADSDRSQNSVNYRPATALFCSIDIDRPFCQRLDAWGGKAATAHSVEEVFGVGSGTL
jgi:hypothetical protein